MICFLNATVLDLTNTDNSFATNGNSTLSTLLLLLSVFTVPGIFHFNDEQIEKQFRCYFEIDLSLLLNYLKGLQCGIKMTIMTSTGHFTYLALY